MRKKPLFLAILALFALPACTLTTLTPTTIPPATAAATPISTAQADLLFDIDWILNAYGPAASPTSAAAELKTGLTFHTNGSFEASMGCNGIQGDFSLQGNRISIEDLVYSSVNCDGPAKTQQDLFLYRIFADRAKPTFALDGDTLTVTSADGSTVMIFKAPTLTVQTNSLAGTSWVLSAYGPAASPTPAAADLRTSLVFYASGKLKANMGCNSIEGDYSVQGDKLTIERILFTFMLCDEHQMRQEYAFGQVFSDRGQETFTQDGNILTVTSADGGTVVTFTTPGSWVTPTP